ncbi:hypothetical protein K1719_009566 [Acacia pycnantha]|nr:hypothetical protein K1719_009566 [Acacia pycnantha]
MEAKILTVSRNPAVAAAHRKLKHKPRRSCVVGVLTRPANDITEGQTIVYKDNWFDRLAIRHLSKNVQEASGLFNSKSGYDSLVEAATVVSQKFNPFQQRGIVIQALEKSFPRPILSFIKTVMPSSRIAREYFAAFTTMFFAWLVGHCEVRESEVNGIREKNVVHIKKCRFLEQTNCVGMCVNLCKMPSQSFIKDSLGMPVNMVPNFDDMSCEMIFGQDPAASTDDPALKQPCYKLCSVKKKHGKDCLN